MNLWVIVVAVLIGLVVLAKVVGLIKSMFRMTLALIIGVGGPWAMYVVIENVLGPRLDINMHLPTVVYILVGAVLALSMLFKMRA